MTTKLRECTRVTRVLFLLCVVLLLVGCASGDITDPVYFSEVYDASIEYGTSNITAGDTNVIVPHNLGVAPSIVLLTLCSDPGNDVVCWVKNPQPLFFGVEINRVLGTDLHFYWWAKK